MNKSCYTCIHRLHDGEDKCYKIKGRDVINTYYTCDISRSNAAVIKVTTEHKARIGYYPSPYHFMNWRQLKRIVDIANDPRLLASTEKWNWDEEKFFSEILLDLKTR